MVWLPSPAVVPTQRSLLPLDDTLSVAASLSQFQRSHLTAAGSSHSSDQTSWQGPKGSSASTIIPGALMRLHLDAPFIVIPNIAPPSDVAEGFYLGSQATQSHGSGFCRGQGPGALERPHVLAGRAPLWASSPFGRPSQSMRPSSAGVQCGVAGRLKGSGMPTTAHITSTC